MKKKNWCIRNSKDLEELVSDLMLFRKIYLHTQILWNNSY